MVQLFVRLILHGLDLYCSTTGVTKAVVCAVLSGMWDGAYKRTLVVNWKE